ncbi:MAG TPA: glycosyltransferase family 4 protein [Gemmatimonadaceae bacterium]|nr:glycosyltransferase family 4 protein [Gemmatimonadaceae bacterium]
MTTILTLADYYLPGTHAGGALRSLANLITTLGDELDFRVITRDRDWLSDERYSNITPGVWESVGPAKVMYLAPEQVRPGVLRRVIAETPHDVLYLNSLFSRVLTLSVLAFRRLRMIPDRPTVLAPRGQLTPGAMGINSGKKAIFLAAARAAGLYRNIIWQASSPDEKREVHEHFDASKSPVQAVVAPDLPTPWDQLAVVTHRRKTPGALKATFISRIARKKNLLGAVDLLRGMKSPAQFDIYGPPEDPGYLRECEAAMATLPPHISARYAGALEYEDIAPTFAQYDLFLFPTLGENFGHVLVEALAAGCPVAVSDRMPFRDLESRGAGWVVPLEAPERFRAALEACAAMDPDTHARMSNAAREFARRVISDPVPIEQNRRLFLAAASQNIA